MKFSKERYADDWLERPEHLRDGVLADANAIEREFRSLDGALGHRRFSIMNVEALRMVVLDTAARTIIASRGLDAQTADFVFDWEMAEAASRQSSFLFSRRAHARTLDAAWVYVSTREARDWALPEPIGAAIAEQVSGCVLAVAPSLTSRSPLYRACGAYGLSTLETKVVAATLQAGNIRVGAQLADVSYNTAREAISAALAKVGVRRLPGLLHRLSLLALGVFPNSDEAANVLADTWGLTPRQSQIAILLAEGLTRSEAARALSPILSFKPNCRSIASNFSLASFCHLSNRSL